MLGQTFIVSLEADLFDQPHTICIFGLMRHIVRSFDWETGLTLTR